MKNIPVRRIVNRQVINDPVGVFSIRDVAMLLNGKNLVHELHRHDFFFILALRNGEGTHEIDFTRHVVCDDSIFFLRPGQVHQLRLAAGCTGFLVEFDAAFYRPKDSVTVQRLKKVFMDALIQCEAERFEKLISVLDNVFSEFSTQGEDYVDAIKAYLDIFFVECMRHSRSLSQNPQRAGSYTQDRFDELLALLESNITRIKSVTHYAELLNLSPYQLNSITKAAVGKPASALIDEQIILEAKRHLLATSHQVKDIAYSLGYEDVSYFIRFFKKHTTYSPEAFRQEFK